MKRKKLEGLQLAGWEQVDEAIRDIGRIDRGVTALEADMNEQIEYLKSRVAEACQPMLREKEYLELQIKHFCEKHRDEMDGKSRRLNFGEVSFRLSTRIIIRGVENCLAELEARGLHQCVLVKKTPNRDAMKLLDDATLAEVGARREVKDVFGYEVDVEKVEAA